MLLFTVLVYYNLSYYFFSLNFTLFHEVTLLNLYYKALEYQSKHWLGTESCGKIKYKKKLEHFTEDFI